jgi:putative membrane protein
LDDPAVRKLIAAASVVVVAPTAAAHHTIGGDLHSQFSLFNGCLAALLVASALLYAIGVQALWRKAGAGRGIRRSDVARFALGWISLATALLSPIDEYADRSFALHMVQHELLMIVAAPLMVLGRPLEAFAWALSTRAKRFFSVGARWPPARKVGWLLTAPVGAWTLHALALWVWHVPVLFKAALTSLPLHVLQHACFFASALGLWWAVFGSRERVPGGASVASLFTTMLHTSALGALLTFAPTGWYSLDAAPAFGFSAVEDQQLGGLVMWIPGGFAYMIAGLVIIETWLAPARKLGVTLTTAARIRRRSHRLG